MAPRPRSKARPAPVVCPTPADEETIDLDDVSDASEEETLPLLPPTQKPFLLLVPTHQETKWHV